MAAGARVLRGMLVRRAVAAARAAALLAGAQMEPARADLHALLALVPFGLFDGVDRFDMGARFFIHAANCNPSRWTRCGFSAVPPGTTANLRRHEQRRP